MSKSFFVASYALVSLFVIVLAGPALAQGVTGNGPGIMGTPPPVGQTILEVATTVVTPGLIVSPLIPGNYTVADIELPLPVFPSSGLEAESSQCLWTFVVFRWGGESAPIPLSGLSYYYTLEGRNLHIEFSAHDLVVETQMGFFYEATAVAIRTAPPAPVESKSFGEIKAMYRDE